ncbi:MAG: PPA1309 family protein [Actinomycetota bacterium]|nr:PPA1309 family protein [Actinomycetota bacterium]
MTEPSSTELGANRLSLRGVVVEVEHYVSDDGWDQPGRLFALVPTAELVEAQPDLAIELGVHASTHEALTPVEQEIDQDARSLEELLDKIAWPSAVVGAVAVVERVVLPPAVEDDVPQERGHAATFAAEHPAREDVRIVAGVLRTGDAHCVLRLRSHDDDDHLVHGADLVPRLLSALRETLEEADDDEVGQDWGPDE